jgi:hypothetical protein
VYLSEIEELWAMFSNKRYITNTLRAVVPDEIILGLWIMIDNRRSYGAELSYLQVFKLSEQDGEQRIIHEQEQPDYHNDITLPFIAPPVREATVFAIDEGGYSTMLLADEY